LLFVQPGKSPWMFGSLMSPDAAAFTCVVCSLASVTTPAHQTVLATSS
jgi:hypothetical protein